MPCAKYPLQKLSTLIRHLETGVSVNAEASPALPGEHGVLKVSAVGRGRFWPNENKTIRAKELARMGPSIEAGDILVSRANTLELVGVAARVEADYPHLHLSDKTWRLRLLEEDEGTSKWLVGVLNSPIVRASLRQRASGTSGSMKNVSQAAYLGIEIPVPPAVTRRRIACFLDCLAGLSHLIDDLINAKRRFHRGLAQQLLFGRVQLPKAGRAIVMQETPYGPIPSDWQYVEIRAIATQTTERAGDRTGLPVLACSKRDGLVESFAYFGRRVYSADVSKYRVVRRGEFAFPSNHVEEGSIGLLTTHDAGLVSPIYIVFAASKRVVPEYLFAVLKTNKYRQIFSAATNESVNRRGSLRWPDFSRIRVPLPPLRQQRAIARLLGSLEREIVCIERLGSALNRQRAALTTAVIHGQLRTSED